MISKEWPQKALYRDYLVISVRLGIITRWDLSQGLWKLSASPELISSLSDSLLPIDFDRMAPKRP
jgi:hypothetical protein